MSVLDDLNNGQNVGSRRQLYDHLDVLRGAVTLFSPRRLRTCPGLFQEEQIKKEIMSSSHQRLVVVPFLISVLKNEGMEQP